MMSKYGKALQMRCSNISKRAAMWCQKHLRKEVEKISLAGGTPLVVTKNGKAYGVIHLKDIVKGGHQGAVYPAQEDGHQNGHDHR